MALLRFPASTPSRRSAWAAKERMRRLMRLAVARRIDLTPLFTDVFPLDQIERAYAVFGSRQERALKVAVRQSPCKVISV